MGSGAPRRRKFWRKANVDPGRNSDELTADEQVRIRHVIDADYKVEGDLRRDMQQVDQAADGSGMLSRLPPSPGTYPCAASGPIPMRERAKDRARSSRARKGAAQGLKCA